MGKGYNNYMCKKPFHPGSKANIKRAWMAEQKTENDKKKQEELKVQYEKEQDLYNNRALISSESKDKLELNFMYEAPPGAKRERQKEDDEPEYKFEWQRKYNAPREDYAKGNADIKDQPFGIPVRNVRCIKCHKWGHINTDKECPLYSQASTSSMPTTSMDPMELMRQMREDGYGLKENVLGHHLNPKAANQQLIPSDESDPETEFLKSLSTAEKKKLLRKLKKLSKKQKKNEKKKKSKKSHKNKAKELSESDSEGANKKGMKRKHRESSSSSSDSSSEEEESPAEKNNKKRTAEDPKKSKAEKFAPKFKSSSDIKEEENSQKTNKSKHKTSNVLDDDHNRSSHAERNQLKSNPEAFKKSKNKSNMREHTDKYEKPHTSKKDFNVKEKSTVASACNWKSSYSSSSENGDIGENVKPTQKENNYTEHETEKHSSKRIKLESSDSDKKLSKMDLKDKSDSEKPDHPDGFSHFQPQAKIETNYLMSEGDYKGKLHDRFRDLNRDKRSPSVKQKYNK